MLERGCGLLLHPTSLPGPYHVGSFGAEARRFVDFLHRSGQKYWQILPLGPTGYGDSPYQCFSAFAGNHLLIDIDLLIQDGLLPPSLRNSIPVRCTQRADFDKARKIKNLLFRKAFRTFNSSGGFKSRLFLEFSQRNLFWLEGYAFYQSLKKRFEGISWFEWPEKCRKSFTYPMEQPLESLDEESLFHRFLQYIFDAQWRRLKNYASSQGISIIGDMPIFVAADSADTWNYREIFKLDRSGHPGSVAGVPPDYFSATGQLWGNPLYRWKVLRNQGYQWWIERFSALKQWVDIIRIDHFRGFEKYWSVPASETTAMNGKWMKGPGSRFFKRVLSALPDLKIIAEDLGFITPEVHDLRNRFHFPGMKVLLFAFDGSSQNPYLPHNYSDHNCVVYTGTHDNDTINGFFYGHRRSHKSLISKEASEVYRRINEYCGHSKEPVRWKLMRLAYASIAKIAITTVQDALGLGRKARMNLPGTATDNWQWRLDSIDRLESVEEKLKLLAGLYNR